MPADFIVITPQMATPTAVSELLAALRVVIPAETLDMIEECGPGDNPDAYDVVRRALGYPIHLAQEG